jgi:hypothetical protein
MDNCLNNTSMDLVSNQCKRENCHVNKGCTSTSLREHYPNTWPVPRIWLVAPALTLEVFHSFPFPLPLRCRSPFLNLLSCIHQSSNLSYRPIWSPTRITLLRHPNGCNDNCPNNTCMCPISNWTVPLIWLVAQALTQGALNHQSLPLSLRCRPLILNLWSCLHQNDPPGGPR